ncbi:MAG: hypothetical protein Q8M76_14805, partial [Spirochaetaceae bacterium]|nr:hypothetical protein [Spirochaetaceae bacterium]
AAAARATLGRGSSLGLTLGAPLLSLLNAPPYTGTSGWIIQNIYEAPAKVIFANQPATFLRRPLLRLDADLCLPIAGALSFRGATGLECFALQGERLWSQVSGLAALGLSYRFGEEEKR